MTLTNHGYTGYAVVVNKKFWDGLPPDIRAELSGAMKEATQFANDTARKDNEAALESLKKSGKIAILTLTPAERDVWKQEMTKVHREVESRVGKEIIEAIYKETGFTGASK
jgi:C4-dicarboxylate-binding protein DctP